MIPHFCGVTLHCWANDCPCFLRTVLPSSLGVERPSRTFRPDDEDIRTTHTQQNVMTFHKARILYCLFPTLGNTVQCMMNHFIHFKLLSSGTYYMCTSYYARPWWNLRYVLLCPFSKKPNPKKTVDIMLELSPLGCFKQSKRHPRLEAVCTVATQRKDLAWCSNLCAPLLEIPSPLKCQLPISFSTWQYI